MLFLVKFAYFSLYRLRKRAKKGVTASDGSEMSGVI